jgi:hypothetical protein
MSTIAWLFILAGLLVFRAVVRGRVMEIPQDLSDAFLAIVNGNDGALGEALGRTGPGNIPDVGATVGASTETVTGIGAAIGASLGAVKPHVTAAATYFAGKYGIEKVGGYRSTGSVPNSDHPKGLALDFMTKDKAKGDALAADLIAQKDKFGVKYVIWWGKINTLDGRGWRPYSGPSNHKDHVHASFKASV